MRAYQARDAVELAAEGIDGLETFEMPVSTAGGLAANERRRRDRNALIQLERKQPGYADRVGHKALDILDRELDRLGEKSKKQPLDLDDITPHAPDPPRMQPNPEARGIRPAERARSGR